MKFQELLESYGMLTKQQRLFYPRNFSLSPEFIAALKKEILRQHKAGMDPDQFAQKLHKALLFFITDFKRTMNAKKVTHEPDALADRPALAAERKVK